MKLVLGADSAGRPLLEVVMAHLQAKGGHEIADLSGTGTYAETAVAVAKAVRSGQGERGLLFCGTGIGVCMAANKVPGIRAAQVHDTYSAERAAKSNNAHIITMGARVIGPELAKAIADSWLAARFDPQGPSAANVRSLMQLEVALAREFPPEGDHTSQQI
jgi:ribose 5-phosphate isomerase B